MSSLIEWIIGSGLGNMPQKKAPAKAQPGASGPGDVNGGLPQKQRPSTNQPKKTGLVCIECEREGIPCDGEEPCSNCEQSGTACTRDNSVGAIAARGNLRIVICNCFQSMEDRSATVDDLVHYLQHHWDESDRYDHEQLTDFVEKIMSAHPETFIHDEVSDGKYNLAGGFGRSLDSATAQRLIASCGQPDYIEDDLDLDIAVVFSITRKSGPYRRNDVHARVLKRCEDLMHGYHVRFSSTGALRTQATDAVHLAQLVGEGTPCWVPSVREPGSSNREFINERTGDNAILFEMLERLNAMAEAQGQKVTDLLLFNGYDGLTTNNTTWRRLAELFPWLHLRLTVLTSNYTIDSGFTRPEPHLRAEWLHLDVGYLCQLHDALPTVDMHLCRQQDMIPPSRDDDAPLHISCDLCREVGILSDANDWCVLAGSHGFAAIQAFFCHARFLIMTELICHFKSDYSVFHYDRAYNKHKAHVFAAHITNARRNNIVVPTLDEMHCERCRRTEGPFRRGETHKVALRCLSACEPLGDVEGDIEPPAQQDGDQYTYRGKSSTSARSFGSHKAHRKRNKIALERTTETEETPAVREKSVRKRYECLRTGCDDTFERLYNVRIHIERVHDGPYPCVQCNNFSFTSKATLTRHTIQKHTVKG